MAENYIQNGYIKLITEDKNRDYSFGQSFNYINNTPEDNTCVCAWIGSDPQTNGNVTIVVGMYIRGSQITFVDGDFPDYTERCYHYCGKWGGSFDKKNVPFNDVQLSTNLHYETWNNYNLGLYNKSGQDELNYYKLESTIPVFTNKDDMIKYVKTGEWTPPKPPINYGIHYHVAVEGTYRPNFYISWDSEGIDADPIIANNTTVSVAPFYGSFKGTSALFTVNYTKKVVMMSYDRLMQETNPVGWDQIITSLVEKFGGTETGATMKALRLDPDDPTKTISTSQCFFESNAHGEKGNCGLVFPDIDDGSTVDFISFNPEQYEDKDTDPDNPNGGDESDNIPTDVSPLETSSTLTKSYVVTQSTLQNIGNQLWASGFIDNIKLVNNNPIENIISVKALAIPLTGTSEDIQIGNVSMGITGFKISNGYGKKVIGSCTVGEYYNSYLDYAPFTKITIFLPYVGYKELDVNQVMNKRLTISYAVDYITGAVKAIINNGVANIASFDGNCGVDIPITSSNRAQVEMGYVASAVGAVSSVATGDMTGAVMSGLSGVQNQFHSETKGQSSPNVACYEGTACYLVIERPVVNGSSRFANTYGLPLNCTKKLKDLNGFTVVDPSINLYGIGASDTEKEELRNIMSTGFFI